MWEFQYQYTLTSKQKDEYRQSGFDQSLENLLQCFMELYRYEQTQEPHMDIKIKYAYSETGEILTVEPYDLFSDDGYDYLVQYLRSFRKEDYIMTDLYYLPDECLHTPKKQFLLFDLLSQFDKYLKRCTKVKWIPYWNRTYFIYVPPVKRRGSILPHRKEIIYTTKFLQAFRYFVLANARGIFVF